MYRWWSLVDDVPLGGVYVPLVEFSRGCASGGVYVPLAELSEDIHLVGEMYLVFTRMPGESYRGRLRSLFVVFVF